LLEEPSHEELPLPQQQDAPNGTDNPF